MKCFSIKSRRRFTCGLPNNGAHRSAAGFGTAETPLPFVFVFCLLLSAVIGACSKTPAEEPVFSTWSSRGETVCKTNPIAKEESLPEGAVPWGGTVSHHLLADELIDEWFSELAAARKGSRRIETFYILSPSHWGLSLYDWSITAGSWKTASGIVRSSKRRAAELAQILTVPYDNRVFEYEHGVSTLIPYIAKYFPEAEVIALAYEGEPPVNMDKAKTLAAAVQKVFSVRDTTAFLLISADFSHRSGIEKTKEKDAKTRHFFISLKPALWTLGICDNRPAMYVLSRLFTENTVCTIQRTADAYQLTEETDPNDITSYFFTYFWEKE